ncbi:MAG: MBL fold metallo-hydrolase [Candidatus Eisenbacteria bacterium]|uniref:MBL fold metallo-hydrolase n=1 Tax=Eiseniibacteriota bacterium TaxID=2212470 RepID=A0A956NH56_UNCEI|nr:MBL fold metallo-hydrolase [Candidatus Eisenbacteria bacterium]MCB9463790.1 MBL fold metallo-hydrolase [Candidatus Eisenbacteria bacterium]
MLQICALASGSSGNATVVSSGTTHLLVDAGASAGLIVDRLADLELAPPDLSGILVTHSHGDHYRSVGTLHARFGVPVFVDPSTAAALRRKARRTSWKRVTETAPIPELVGDIEVEALDTSHGDPQRDGRTVCFQFRHGRRRVAVVTDLGSYDDRLVGSLKGVDAILLEANYEESVVRRKLSDRTHSFHWRHLRTALGPRGHLSNAQCGNLLYEILAGPWTRVLLGHLSENHPDRELDNNDFETARRTVEDVFTKRGSSSPTIHRTWRTGREPGRRSDLIVTS